MCSAFKISCFDFFQGLLFGSSIAAHTAGAYLRGRKDIMYLQV